MRYYLTIFLFICWNTSFAATFEDGKAAYERNDYELAYSILTPLAEQGEANAQNGLGLLYKNGKGISKDYNEAIKWFRMAANQGFAKAQQNLGIMYANGEGVLQDNNEAYKWYRLAAEQGYSHAQNSVGYMFEKGRGVTKNYSEALKWYKLAAEQGYSIAQNNVVMMYEQGIGVEKNYKEAIEWIKLYTKKDDAKGNYNICYKYQKYSDEMNGRSIKGVDEAYKEAQKYCRISAELGYKEAQFALSLMYEEGLGVKKDINEAITWLKLANNDHNNEFIKNKINELEKIAKDNENKSSDEKQNTKKINTQNTHKNLINRIKEPKKDVEQDNDPLNIR